MKMNNRNCDKAMVVERDQEHTWIILGTFRVPILLPSLRRPQLRPGGNLNGLSSYAIPFYLWDRPVRCIQNIGACRARSYHTSARYFKRAL